MSNKYKIFLLYMAGLLLVPGWAATARADVTIKVRALNPLATTETAVINYPLPQEITEGDIINQKITYSLDHSDDEEPPKTEFNISFDDKMGAYYIDDEVLLKPKEVVTLEVRVKDVWVIERSQVQGIKDEVNSLLEEWEASLAEGQEDGDADEPEEEADPETDETSQQVDEENDDETREFALVMKQEILKGLDEIIKRQDESTIISVGVERHIAAYAENMDELRQVQQDIVLLANLIQYEGEEAEEGEAIEEETDEEALPEPEEEANVESPEIVQEDTESPEEITNE